MPKPKQFNSVAPARPPQSVPRVIRCAIYTRKSTDEGLHQAFNSLEAQREAAEAFIASQKGEGLTLIHSRFDDGGYTGANMDRPALSRLLNAIQAKAVDCVVVYKVDRLSRSLLDFARMMELFEQHGVSFVSVTQQFNTNTSVGRLTLNMLLSFSQFERELISERTRDKVSAARRRGKWVGGHPVLGYDIDPRGGRLVTNSEEAEIVRTLFQMYLEREGLAPVLAEADRRGWRSKRWTTSDGRRRGGKPFTKSSLHYLLTNVIYTGNVSHRGVIYDGEHDAVVDEQIWTSVQNMLRRNGRHNGGGTKNKYGALLRGIVSCATCAAPMVHAYTQRSSKRYRYYVCYNAQQRGWKHCTTKSVAANAIEKAVVDSIRKLSGDSSLIEAVFRDANQQRDAQRAALEAERTAIIRSARNIHREIASVSADDSIEEPVRAERILARQEQVTPMERRVAEIDSMLAAVARQVVDFEEVRNLLGQFDPIWEALTTREKERFIRLLIAQVAYDGRTGKATITFVSTVARDLCQRQS